MTHRDAFLVSYAGSHSGLQVQKDGVGVQDIMDRHSGISRNSVRKYLSLLAPAFPKATLLILRNHPTNTLIEISKIFR